MEAVSVSAAPAPSAASSSSDDAAAASSAAPMLDAEGKPLSKQAQKKAIKAAQLAAEKAAKAAKKGDEKAAQDKERLEKARSVVIAEDKSLPAAKRVRMNNTEMRGIDARGGARATGAPFGNCWDADSHCAAAFSICFFSSLSFVIRLRSARFASTPTSASRCSAGCTPSAPRAT